MGKEIVSVQSGKYVRYRVINKGEEYYVLDMDSHWYTFILGMVLWLLPMKIYPVSKEKADSILYKKNKNFEGTGVIISVVLVSLVNVLLRIFSGVVFGEFDTLLKILSVLTIAGVWFFIRIRWRKKREQEVLSLTNYGKPYKIRFQPSSIQNILRFGGRVCMTWILTQGVYIFAIIMFIQYSNDFVSFFVLNVGTLLVLGFSVLLKDPASLCRYKISEEKCREE